MKKHLLFLFTALTLLLVPAALKADIVTIGDESSTSSHWAVPVNMFYGYSLTQQIYTADEINMPNGGTITSISFEYTSAASFDMSGVQVYMMNVSKDYFESNADIVEVGPEYKVYEGTLYASGAGWVTLNLTSHFHYDGTSNLLVCFYDPTSGFMGDTYQFRTTSTIEDHPDRYLTLGWHHDNICPDLDNLSSFSGYKERRYFRANIRLNINPDITEIYVNDFSEPVWGEHPDYSWSVPAGSHYFIYDESRWHDITSSGANIFPTYTFNEEGHDYDLLFFFSCVYGYHFADYVTVYINGSTELVLSKSHYSSYYIAMTKPFHVTQGNTVLIGDENTTLYNTVSPFNSLYGYSFVEQIYTADEIGTPTGSEISCIRFNMQSAVEQTDQITIYMKNVSRSAFSSTTDYETVTDDDIVYQGDYTFTQGWNTIMLSTPFHYNGTDNLMIALHENTPGYESLYFYYTNKTNSVVSFHNDDSDPNPYNLASWTANQYVSNRRANIEIDVHPSATVNDGPASSEYVPVYGYWADAYLKAEFVLPAASLTSIPGNSDITSMTFYATQSNVTWENTHFKVFLKEVASTTLSAYNGYADATTVYEGDLSIVKGRMTVQFTTPFTYHGGNLLVGVYNTVNNGSYNTSTWIGVTAEGASISGYNKDSWDNIPANQRNFLPKTTFTFTTKPEPFVQIGGGTTNNKLLPTYILYSYSLSEQIYTAAEIGQSGNIYSLAFYNTEDASTRDIDIYLAHTSKSDFSDDTDWGTVTAADIVFSGDVSFLEKEWTTITFTAPFAYNGTDNLLIVVDDNTGDWTGSRDFRVFEATGQALHVHNDYTDFNPSNPGSYTGEVFNVKNQIVLNFGPVSCPSPALLTFSNIGKTSATLNWTENGTASEWQICVNGNMGSLITATSKPYTLNSLTPGTSYTVKVRAVCGNSEVSPWIEETFTTLPLCAVPTDLMVSNITENSADLSWMGSGDGYTVKYSPISVVFSDDFESGLAQWTQIDADGDGFVWGLGSDLMGSGFTSHGGLDIVCSQSYDAVGGALTPDNYLITPQVNLGGTVGFWVKPQDSNYPAEHFGIAVSTTGNTDASDFTTIAEWTLDASDWQQLTVDLSAYAGQTGYVALRHFGCTDNFYLDIDDFTIYGPGPWQTTTTTTANTQLTGLTPETGYLVQVQSDCGSDGTSEWISSIFTTLEVCPTPFSLAASNITPNSADIAWTGFGESYTVKYKPISIVFSDNFESGLGQWTTIDNDGDGFVWGLGSDLIGSGFASHGGSDIVCSQSYDNGSGALTPDNYLITPQVTLGGTVVFWANPQDPSYPAEHFGIAVSTTGNTDASDFTTIAEWTLDANDWQQFTVDLSAYAGQTGYVALRHFGCTDQYYLNIDDFTIYGPEPWQTATTTTNNTQFTGLTPETGYLVQVQSDCGSDGMSDWSEIFIFTTLENTIVSDFIDFETNDFSQHPFNQDATYPWIIADVAAGCDNGSNYCMMSGNAGVHSSTSAIEATHTFPQDGYIAFDAKCMGEGEDYDVCEFYIDGDLKFYYGDDLGGWNHFVYNITAGTHTFKWSYTKDNNVNPEGDAFFVDNIKFGAGEPCTAPWSIAASAVPNGTATVTWQGDNSSFTLQYTLEGSGTWNAIEDITGLSYTISGLAAGNYVVRVAATCDPSNWISTTFSVIEVNSTANWYAYATYSLDNESWRHKFISFSMQDPATLYMATDVVESSGNRLYSYAATYADGYVWAITEDGDLAKATLDNNTKTISNFVTVVPYFDINDSYSLSYNPVDGRLYYFDKNKHLKSFFTADPSNVTTVGTFSLTPKAFAINNAGVGYLIENSTGYLYQVNLSDASTSLVGSTGHESSYTESLGFDTETGELFWAMFASETEIGLYKVNPNTAESHFVGQVGGGSGAEISVLFMVGNITPPCPAPTSLAVSNITENSAELSWTESGTATEWQICVNGNEGSPIDVTENPYTLNGLTPNTSYTVKVRAYCGDAVSDWSIEESFNTTYVPEIQSTANWYSYANSTVDGESWEDHYINFSMQDPATVTAATSEAVSGILSATYANGYMWYITMSNGDLGRAVVDNNNHTISNFETIVSGFESTFATSMSYNPVDGNIYYINSSLRLKRFDPTQPNMPIEIGMLSNNITAFAINSAGEAYGVERSTGNLYHLNLTDASTTLVGSTGHGSYYSLGMAFDLETGELFWAHYDSEVDNALYWVNPATAETYSLGHIGGGNGGEFTCLFMVGNTTPSCPAPTDLEADNITKHTAELSWTETGTASGWQMMVNHDEEHIIDVTGNPYILDNLDAYTEYTVQVRANCGSGVVSDWSDEEHFITLVGCQPSNDLSLESVSYNTATLTWSGEGESFNVEYSLLGSGTWETLNDVLPPYTITGLTPGSDYEVHVIGNCGADGLSNWSNTVEFTTLTCPVPSGLTANNVTSQTADLSWTENGTASEWQISLTDGSDVQIITATSVPAYTLTGLNPNMEYAVMVQSNCEGVWSGWSEMVSFITPVGCVVPTDLYVMESTPVSATLDWSGESESFNVRYRIAGGEWSLTENVIQPHALLNLEPGTTYEAQVQGNCGTDGLSDWSNLVTFTTPVCPVPTGLTVSNITKHTAELNWTENGEAEEWQILVTSDEVNTLTVTEKPYTLTGLVPSMEYTVQVRANCSGSWSGWSDLEHFITPVGCQATNDLAVTDETYSTATLTWTGEGETFNVHYSLLGSGTWETLANVTSPYTLSGLQSSTDYEVQVQNNCGTDGLSDWSNLVTFTTLTCPAPTDLEVTNITKHTADLSWADNGSATEWQILVTSDEINSITVTNTSYTLTGLDAETEYTVEVRANCGESWSHWCKGVHFITDLACHATEDLHVTAVTPNSATVEWTGEGETFNMQYRTSDGEWTTVNNVTSPHTLSSLTANTDYEVQVLNNCGSDGTSGWSNTATFATSLCPAPANLTVTNITKNSAVLNWTETGSATAWELSIDNHYINLLDIGEKPYTLTGLSAGTEYTVKVSSVCGASWSDWSNEVTFTTEVACTPTEDLAVTGYTFNTATLNWTGEGNIFHLRHRIPGGEWIETDGIVPPYTISGLNPGTTYEAQVQNECIGGNLSEWSNLVTFYTSACDPQAIPYAYNFETEEPFYCWSHVTGDVELIQALPSLNHTPNGQYSLAFYESTSDVIAFPQFTQEVNTLQVSFWLRPHNITMSGYGTFAVGYLTDVNDASTFTAVSTYSYDEWPATIDFLRKIVTLQDAPDGAIIAFKHDSPTADGTWYVDDILVSAICDVPTGITVSNITNHSATITWTDNGAASWDVARNNQGNFFHNVTTNEYTFTDLNPGTSNYVLVRSRCGDDILSNWSEQVTFTTLNNSIPTYATITGDSTVCYLSTTLLTAHTDVPATYLWSNGATTQQINVGAGTYQVTVTSATGDELASEPFTLTENPSLSGEESRSICPDELPYTWNGHTFPETGMAYVTLTASNGCDSLVTMFLSVNPTYNDTIETTICDDQLPYIFAGEYLFESGEYVDSLQTVKGCDSVVVLSLTVNPSYAMKAVEFICSSQLPYEWNGVTFYEEGTEVASFESVNGCDSLVVMTLIVNQSYRDSVEATICNGETYNFYGQLLTTDGEYTHTMQTLDGCDSVVVLTLTVNPTYTLSEERSVCPGALPYVWNGVTFNEAGEQTATLQTINGCDSVVTMILSVNDAYEVTVTQSVCASELPIVWNGKTFTEAGTQLDTLTAANGCDSIVTMVLTVNIPVNMATTIESCGEYTWEANGETYTESGTHYYEHPDANGCTQVDTLYLTIHTPVNTAITEAACGSYTWTGGDGVTYTESGTYYNQHQDANGCTQIDTLYLTIYTPTNTAIMETACGSFTWTGGTGVTYTESGTYYYVHQDDNGCTQIDTLYLTIYTPTNTAIMETACGSFTWTGGTGVTYTESGTYYYEHQDAHNCTQVDTLYLTIYTPENTAITETVCGSYTWTGGTGVTYTESGTYYYVHQDANSCTQVDTLYLTVYTPQNTAITEAACGSYTWTGGTGVTYTESGTYYYVHQDANGCTQVDTLYLTIHNPVNTAITVSECGSYTWAANGQTYTVSNTYYYEHLDANGCTQVDTLYLTINNPVNTAITVSECGSYTWAANGQTYTVSNTYYYEHQDANGCTQVDTLYLTIHNPVNTAVTVSECGSYTWTGGTGVTYTQSGEYTYAHTDVNGCTQVDTLHLTILQSSSATLTNSICASELPIVWNGVTFTEAGSQTVTLTAANGCDSVITMVLTVNTPVNTAVTATDCGSYTWAANGQTYTSSGVYTYIHQDAYGCTQVDTLYLTINNPVNTAITVSECGSYTWNNQTYTASGVYTYSHTDANGCTQVDTLYLTILQPVQVELYETACGSYTWNGQTYTQSNDYSATFTASNGCDSIVVLHLTVYTPANTAITVEECDSYTWTDGDGQTYTISGNYTYSHVDANGCTQVDTLHLTLHYATSSEFTIETSDSCYTWNGQTYCASGNYVQTLQTVNGCDSVVTLHLTTSVGVTDHEVEVVFLAPNPTKNICRIMGLETDPISVDLYDMRGKLVMKASGRELDVTMLPTGLYMVKIYTGDRFINLKLVKQ